MSVKKFDKDYFLRHGYDKSIPEWQLFYQEQILELKKYRGDATKLCDVGCGFGDFLELCDKFCWVTYGVDISEHAIYEAKKRTKAKLVVYDIQDGIPFEETFDAMTCFDLVEHLEKPEEVLSNMFYKLNRGGILVLTTPNLRSHIWSGISGWQEDKTHISVKSPKEWKKLLDDTGFKIIFLKSTFPILQRKQGMKGLVAKMLAKIGFGSTLYIFATKWRKK